MPYAFFPIFSLLCLVCVRWSTHTGHLSVYCRTKKHSRNIHITVNDSTQQQTYINTREDYRTYSGKNRAYGGNVEVMAIHEICKVFLVIILYLKAK
jgi:hypothetical protein